MDKNKSPSKLKTDANFHELRSTLDDEIYRKWDQYIFGFVFIYNFQREQKFLRTKLKEVNDFDWSLQNSTLKYIGGVDVSFSKVDKNLACSYLVVLEYPSLKIVYKDYEFVHLDLPYIPGFLAFREAPHLLKLIEKLKKTKSQFIPQVILVDGNGILHQNGFGLASHLGVLANIPTIGCGKTVFYVDGIGVEKVEKMSKENLHKKGDFFKIVGHSKRTWGAAVCTDKNDEPLIVSIGHRISLDTAIEVVKACSKTRIPEPIRIADQNSRYQMRDGTKKGVTDSTSARNEMTFIKGQEIKAVAKKEAPKVVDDDGWIKVGK